VASASPPREESSGAATYPTAPNGLWTIEIKKDLAAPGMQVGSLVSKARSCVTEGSARRADIPLQFGSTWLQCDTTRQDSTTALTMFSIAG
jgi:hypothetical protein